MEVTVKGPLGPGDKISVDLETQFVKDTLSTGDSDKFRGKCKPLYGIVNSGSNTHTSMLEKKCDEDLFAVSRSQDGVYCKIVAVDIQAQGSGY